MGNKAFTRISVSEVENASKAFEKVKGKAFFNELQSLQSSIEGKVVLPSPEDLELYHEARRRPYNVEFRGFPLVIVRPKSSEDVSKIISFVREKCDGIIFCVQCGGHSTRCMITDSFCIDLIYMKTVRVDLEKSLVEVGGGAYLKEVDDALKPHGLGTPVGTYPLTGVGGLVLAGGYGFLSRMHGMSVDNLVEVEIVLANGKVVIANDDNEYKNLIWGCRGGGGNFGIVTKFTFKVHKLPPKLYGGLKVYLAPTIKSAVEIHRNFDKMITTLPDSVTGFIVIPAAEPVVPTVWAYFGDKPSVKDVPELNANLGGWMCVMNNIKPISYHADLQTITQPMNSPGQSSYTSLVQVGTQSEIMPDAFFEQMLSYSRKSLPRSLSKAVVIMFAIGGQLCRADDGAKTAVNSTVRQARYFLIIESVWKEKFGDEGRNAARDWVKGAVCIGNQYRVSPMLHAPDSINNESIEAAVSGAVEKVLKMTATINLNDAGSHDLGYTASLMDRLAEVKGIYDPQNFFRQNANILPATNSTSSAL